MLSYYATTWNMTLESEYLTPTFCYNSRNILSQTSVFGFDYCIKLVNKSVWFSPIVSCNCEMFGNVKCLWSRLCYMVTCQVLCTYCLTILLTVAVFFFFLVFLFFVVNNAWGTYFVLLPEPQKNHLVLHKLFCYLSACKYNVCRSFKKLAFLLFDSSCHLVSY